MADDDNAKTCKVVLLGESGVGKTCIIARFINNTFEDNIMSTTGASYAGKTMTFDEYQGKSIKFEIWDTAGQEKYRALTKIFYKDAGVAILVYDITRKESFEELKNYWAEQIKDSSPKEIILAVAANKSDLIEKEAVDEGEARDFAKEYGAIFCSTTATNTAGVTNLFEEVAKKYSGANSITIKNDDEEPVVEQTKKKDTVKLTDAKKKEGKKGCCK